jgi:hypothetical protein
MPSWLKVLASPDERVLWAILAAALVAALAGLWTRLARPRSFG